MKTVKAETAPTVSSVAPVRTGIDANLPPQKLVTLSEWLDRVKAGRVHPENISAMLHSLSLLVKAGVPVGRSMEILAQQEPHPALRDVLTHMVFMISKQGAALGAAFKKFPHVFPPATLLLIRAGEISGELSARSEQAARLIERQTKLSNDVKSSLTTPVITAVACLGMTWGIVHFVMPGFLDMYASMKIELPLISKLVVALVEVVNSPITTVGFLAAAGFAWIQRSRIHDLFFKAAFHTAGTRKIVGQVLATSFCDIVGRLYGDGVAISSSLEMLAASTSIKDYQRRLEIVTVRFKSDGQLSEALKLLDFFPSAVVHMVKVGEETGALDKMLLALHDMLDEQNQDLLQRIVVTIEPLMMGIVGGLLAFLAVGMFLPIYNLLSHLGV